MRNGEFLYQSTPLTVLTTAEVGLGITAACAATLRPLFDRGGSQKLQSDPRFTAMLAQGIGGSDGAVGAGSEGTRGDEDLGTGSGLRMGLVSTNEKKEEENGLQVVSTEGGVLESQRETGQTHDIEKGGLIVHTTVVSEN